MLNLPIQSKHALAPGMFLILVVLLYLAEPLSSDYLAFDRQKIQAFELWRLLSGNFLHTNFNHLLLNGLGLALLWALHGQYFSRVSYLITFLLMSLSGSLGVYFFSQDLNCYVGLSGTLHGLLVVGAYRDIRSGLKSGWLLLIGVWLKIADEQCYGASEDVAELIAANVATEAHLYGALSGMLLLSFMLISKRLLPERNKK
jgi:rhomboid family GlyGly-CTERM serine protease